MQTSIITSVRITPIGLPIPSIRRPVEKSIAVLKRAGLSCRSTSTCTEIQDGSWHSIMDAIHDAAQACLDEKDITRVFCDIHVDMSCGSKGVVGSYHPKITMDDNSEDGDTNGDTGSNGDHEC